MSLDLLEHPQNSPSASHASALSAIMRGAGSLYVGTIVQLAGRLLFAILVARWVGAEAIGIFTIGLVALQAFVMVATSGVEVGLYYFVSPAAKSRDWAAVKGMFWGSILSTCGLALLLSFSYVVFVRLYPLNGAAGPQAQAALMLFAPALVFQTLVTVLGSFGLALGSPRIRVVAERFTATIAQLILLVIFLALGLGTAGVILAYVVGITLAAAVGVVLIRRVYPRTKEPMALGASISKLYRYSYKQGLARIVGYVLMNANLFVLGYVSSAAEVGIYAAASRLTLVGLLFLEAFGQMFGTSAANHEREAYFREDYQRVTKWTVMFSAPLFVLLAAFASTWMMLMGPEFESGAIVLVILALSQLLSMFTGSTGFLLAVRGRPDLSLLNTVLGWGTSAALTVLLAPAYGALGAAVAFFAAMLVFFFLEASECRLVFGFFPFSRTMLKPLVLLSGLGIAAVTIARWQTWSVAAALLWSALLLGLYALLMWRWALQRVDVEVFNRILGTARARLASS